MNNQKSWNRHPAGEFLNTLRQSQFLWVILKSALIGLIFIKSFQFSYNDFFNKQHTLTDFDTFHIAGTFALKGKLAEAYHANLMRQAQIEWAHEDTFMPWTYPLPFNLLTSLLALLPIGPAYLLFSGFSLLSLLGVLRRLTGELFRPCVFLIIPALLVNLNCGQNGLMTAALMGVFCYGYLRGDTRSGIPLGMMIIKPHLAAGILVHLILRKEWRILVTAGTTSLALLALATGVFGPMVWQDYFISIREASHFLHEGFYPMHRMTSAFSALLTLSGNFEWARIAQFNSILVAIGVQAWTIRQNIAPRNALGISCIASSLYSPYFYDYDLTILSLGVGLLLHSLENQLSRLQWFLFTLALILTQSGWLPLVIEQMLGRASDEPGKLSLSFFFLLPILWIAIESAKKDRSLPQTP
jgi:hypothetical protein